MTDNRPEQFFSQIVQRLTEGGPFALATVVHTAGSTPQKAGARAIILPDGRVLGTLGGGCMEAECRRRALEMVRAGGLNTETRRHGEGLKQAEETLGGPGAGPPTPEHSNTRTPEHRTPNTEHLLLDLHLDDDFGWDDGLICGGSSQIFIQLCRAAEPSGDPAETKNRPTPDTQHRTPNTEHRTPDPHNAYAAAIALKAERRRGVLAMVVSAPHPADAGRTLLIPEDGPVVGALGDAALAEEISGAALGLLREGIEAPRRLRLSGDEALVYLEPVLPRPVLLIVGAGHIGAAVCRLAASIGFEVAVADDRASFANTERLPDADQVLVDDVIQVARRWPKTPETYVLLVTRGHRNDANVLREVIGSPCAYVGMIGSRRKVLTIYDEFLAEGIATPEQLAAVHAPVGLDIGALTVDEIAVSIAAELIAIRRKGIGRRGSCPVEGASDTRQPAPHTLDEGARHADCNSPGRGGVPAYGDAEAALAVRQRERDRAGRPLADRLPDRRRTDRGGPPRG